MSITTVLTLEELEGFNIKTSIWTIIYIFPSIDLARKFAKQRIEDMFWKGGKVCH